MSAIQQAKNPVGAGLIANETADAAIVALSLEKRKAEATLRAQLALRGHVVHRTVEGGYLVVRQGNVKHCADLDALQAFGWKVGAVR
jgi:hypothetical protein